MTVKPKSAEGDWAKQLRFDMQFAEKTLRDRGSMAPMFIIRAQGGCHVIAIPWKNDEEKANARELVHLMCIAHNATALTFISEVWMRRVMRYPRESEAEHQARIDAVMPRDAEDRSEAVVVCLAWRDDAGERQTLFQAREIERRDNGKPSGLAAPPVSLNYDRLGGPMTEVLPDKAPTAQEQAIAKLLLDRMVGLETVP